MIFHERQHKTKYTTTQPTNHGMLERKRKLVQQEVSCVCTIKLNPFLRFQNPIFFVYGKKIGYFASHIAFKPNA